MLPRTGDDGSQSDQMTMPLIRFYQKVASAFMELQNDMMQVYFRGLSEPPRIPSGDVSKVVHLPREARAMAGDKPMSRSERKRVRRRQRHA